jgi:hypothetical protein
MVIDKAAPTEAGKLQGSGVPDHDNAPCSSQHLPGSARRR